MVVLEHMDATAVVRNDERIANGLNLLARAYIRCMFIIKMRDTSPDAREVRAAILLLHLVELFCLAQHFQRTALLHKALVSAHQFYAHVFFAHIIDALEVCDLYEVW